MQVILLSILILAAEYVWEEPIVESSQIETVVEYRGTGWCIEDVEYQNPHISYTVSQPSNAVSQLDVSKAIASLVDRIESDYIRFVHDRRNVIHKEGLEYRLTINAEGVITAADLTYSDSSSYLKELARDNLEGNRLTGLPKKSFVVELSLYFYDR